MATFRYIRWTITLCKTDPPNANVCQFAELRMRQSGSPVAWNGGVSAGWTGSNSESGDAAAAVDGNTSNKLVATLFNSADGVYAPVVVTIDNSTDITFDAYDFVTANDEASRDPDTWELHGSANGSDWTLLDTVSGANVTSSRNTATQEFPLSGGPPPEPSGPRLLLLKKRAT